MENSKDLISISDHIRRVDADRDLCGTVIENITKRRIFAFSWGGRHLELFCNEKKRRNDVPVSHAIIHFCFLLIDDITLFQLTFLYDNPQSLCLRFGG